MACKYYDTWKKYYKKRVVIMQNLNTEFCSMNTIFRTYTPINMSVKKLFFYLSISLPEIMVKLYPFLRPTTLKNFATDILKGKSWWRKSCRFSRPFLGITSTNHCNVRVLLLLFFFFREYNLTYIMWPTRNRLFQLYLFLLSLNCMCIVDS